MTRLLCVLATTVVGCTQEPRTPNYFENHPEAAATVLHACAAGTHRGAECENAQVAKARLDAKARMDLFRRGFE